ncbi:MAG TPA: YfhO family protein [Candidatus Binatia bacterium]|nr:YfhO family protein [Candidatus Binatia bacterium]
MTSESEQPETRSGQPGHSHWLAFLPAALLPVAVILFFWKLALTGLILARGDTFLYFYPYWQAAADALKAGRVPLWNPAIFMGAPFVANSQAGFFYPPNWPLWLLLRAPYAVSASIVLHVMLAALGAYMLARKQLRQTIVGAALAAVAFALGGYLSAQVEHVNQLQGLAWMPWLLAGAGGFRRRQRRRTGVIVELLLAAIIFTLQLLAGHTQTLFISISALLIFRVAKAYVGDSNTAAGAKWGWRNISAGLWWAIGLPLMAVAFSALLGGVQLLPTLELAKLSGRQGGLPLNEAVSFSLHPLLLGHSLLPDFGGGLFTEYVAYFPLTILLLAAVAAWQWRRDRSVLPALALAAGGLFLALGRFNPFYLLLAQLPAFDLFRAPARWLALYALGTALLAGYGLDLLRQGKAEEDDTRWKRPLRWASVLLLGLVALRLASVPLSSFVPLGSELALTWPPWWQVLAWLAELALALWLFSRLPCASRSNQPFLQIIAGTLALAVMFVASRQLPYDQPTTPAASFDLRAPIARLKAFQRCDLLPAHCMVAPGRFLSLSDTFFDPGDLVELQLVYSDRMSEQAFFHFLVATKQKEIIAPNLPMAYGLASVDGFDGGILPLRDYSTLVSLILPEGATTSDGRLREYLGAVPEARWLDLFNARYVITDKVGDEWREGIFFDTQFAQKLSARSTERVGHVPPFEATELWLLADNGIGTVTVSGSDGSVETIVPHQIGSGLWRFPFSEPAAPQAIRLTAGGEPWEVRALTLVDGRDGSFQTLVPGNYRLIYSGDVKIYENLDVLPRAFLVDSWQWSPDVAGSVATMSASAFDPRRDGVVVGQGTDVAGEDQHDARAALVSYRPEEVVVATRSRAPTLLVLTDADYPGWQATVDGEAATVNQVDGLFRGVFLPAGEHEVRFLYRSSSFGAGRWISAAALLAWLVVTAISTRSRWRQLF